MADRVAADGKKKWTILIYFSTDNNLSEEGVFALKELKRVVGPDVNVFAQFDPVGRGNTTRRFHIRQANRSGSLGDEDVVAQLGETDMNDPKTLRDFLVAGITRFREDTTNFMVILAGHGAGVNQGFFLRDEERRLSEIPSSFPLTNLKGQVFNDPELVVALGNKKIDILGFDACMMSMVEVCYELFDCPVLNLAVGSEGFSLNAGWPYHRIVEELEDSYLDPETLAEFIVKDHTEFYADYHLGGLSTDLSAVRLGRIPDLTRSIGELAQALIRKFDGEAGGQPDESEDLPREPPRKYFYKLGGKDFQDAIILTHWATQSYNGEQSVDLYDFCDLLQKRAHGFEGDIDFQNDPQSIYRHCARVKNEIDKAVVLTCDVGAAFQFSRGISITFPWSLVNLAPQYRTLRFSLEANDWLKFLDVYVEATQRLPRRRPTVDFRSTPPYNRGPEGRILSMRNAPTQFKEYVCGSEVGTPNRAAAKAHPTPTRASGKKVARKRKK